MPRAKRRCSRLPGQPHVLPGPQTLKPAMVTRVWTIKATWGGALDIRRTFPGQIPKNHCDRLLGFESKVLECQLWSSVPNRS